MSMFLNMLAVVRIHRGLTNHFVTLHHPNHPILYRGGSRNFRRGFPLVIDPGCRGLRHSPQMLTRFEFIKV